MLQDEIQNGGHRHLEFILFLYCRLSAIWYKISCKYLNPRGNYNKFLKFKMAAVRHLGIVTSSCRTTHEVFSLGHFGLSNFMLIGCSFEDRHIGIWLFFCRIGLKCLIAPQSVFLGNLDPKTWLVIVATPMPQKAYCVWNHVLWTFDSVHILWPVGKMKEFVCLCVFESKKKTKTSPVCPPKMGDPISVKYCTTTRFRDVII